MTEGKGENGLDGKWSNHFSLKRDQLIEKPFPRPVDSYNLGCTRALVQNIIHYPDQ